MATYSLLDFFFFKHTATTEIYTLSLHDALPICTMAACATGALCAAWVAGAERPPYAQALSPARYDDQPLMAELAADRKSTRLNSSHANISYAVFCLKKKKRQNRRIIAPRSSGTG